ncbi:MAG: HNH endonuclease [Labilithrix sp.]|nr:HNH endonuclease [Labilithrix sp.]MCW5817853.1 HNH endonuclease [Labilithrix sp.]
MRIDDLTNEQLLSALRRVLGDERRAVAAMLAYLIEVEKRPIHLEQACSSMHDFCTRKLGLSEDQASRRIAAARLGARFPELIAAIGDGRMHLSGVLQLRALFTEANVDELVAEASGRTRTHLDLLVARYAPKPDVPDTIRPIAAQRDLVTDGPAGGTRAPAVSASAPMSSSPSVQVLPLTVERFQIMFTAAVELRDKLELARALSRHVNPNGDLAVVIERAIDLLLLHLAKTKLGKVKHPRRSKGRANPNDVSRETLREVHERDARQCTFVSANGERCPAREWLEVDHRQPRALGGAGTLENVRLLCRAHNRLAAEQTFGTEHVAHKIEEARATRITTAERSAQPNLIASRAETTSPTAHTHASPTPPRPAAPTVANVAVATNAHAHEGASATLSAEVDTLVAVATNAHAYEGACATIPSAGDKGVAGATNALVHDADVSVGSASRGPRSGRASGREAIRARSARGVSGVGCRGEAPTLTARLIRAGADRLVRSRRRMTTGRRVRSFALRLFVSGFGIERLGLCSCGCPRPCGVSRSMSPCVPRFGCLRRAPKRS